MKRCSPTREGFKAIFRRPSFGLAEIAWRWSLGFAGIALAALTCIEYLDTLPVTDDDLLLLRTRQPVLMGRALQDIFHGSALRLGEASIVLGLGFAIAWVGIASLGRAATLKALLRYFEEDVGFAFGPRPWRLTSLFGLNSLRAAAALATVVGLVGALLLGGTVSSDQDPSPGSAMLVFLAVALLVSLAWLVINWFLSLASMFVVAEGEDLFGAIGSAVGFCRERLGPVVAVSFWFGLAHLGVFFVASLVAVFTLAFVTVLPGGVVLGGVLLVTLLYFAIADFLYVGRLAAYVYIAGSPEVLAVAEMSSPPPAIPPRTLPQSGIDPDELILSDLPLVTSS